MSSVSQQPPYRICVVGGGPAGATAALALSRDGRHSVDLYDAYPHPRQKLAAGGSTKAYVISLRQRGQESLRRAAGILPEQVEGGIVTANLAVHPSQKLLKLPADSGHSLVAPRQALAAYLLDEAAKAGAKLHFGHRLVEIDFESRVATFATKKVEEGDDDDDGKNEQLVQAPYDLLLGCDGSKSTVRTLLDGHPGSGFKVARLEEDTMEYQVAVLPERLRFEKGLPLDSVHSWNDRKQNAICLAFPTHPASSVFVVVFPEGKFAEFQQSPNGYDAPLSGLLPDLSPEHRKALAVQCSASGWASGGTCVWCSSMGSPELGAALVGDAAHGMWPSLGQGANCALETSAVLVAAVRDVGARGYPDAREWSRAVVAEFDRRRHEDAVAAVDCTFGGMGGRLSRGRRNAPLSFKLQVMGMLVLHKLTLGLLVPRPALLRLLTGEADYPYSKARKFLFYYEKIICFAGLAALAAPVVGWWWLRHQEGTVRA